MNTTNTTNNHNSKKSNNTSAKNNSVPFLADFKRQHMLLFTIVVILLQIINIYLKKYSIDIYQVAVVMAAYSFVNLPMTIYDIMMGGIISAAVSFGVYKLFVKFSKNINVLLLNITTFLAVLFFMIIFNCITMPALAYTLMSQVKIPSNPTGYLFSYIIASIIIIILYFLLLKISMMLPNPNACYFSNNNLSQLKQNLYIK